MTVHSPGPSGATPVKSEQPRKRPWWLLALLAVVAIAILLFSLSRCGASSGPSSTGPTAAGTAGGAATSAGAAATAAGGAATGAAATAAGAPATAASGATGSTGTLTAAGGALLPLSGAADAAGSLAAQIGKPVTANGVKVQSVPADEGFWVGTSDTDRVWVQLTGAAGESPYTVKVGDRVDFTGQVVAHDAAFAGQTGVDAAEGADQLTRQGAHITAAKTNLKLSAT